MDPTLQQRVQDLLPPANLRDLSEAEIKTALEPLLEPWRDMEGTTRVSSDVLRTRVFRSQWELVRHALMKVLRQWEDALEFHFGEPGLCFLAELGFGAGRGHVRTAPARGRLDRVDVEAVIAEHITEYEAMLARQAMHPCTRPLTEADAKPRLLALFSAQWRWQRWIREGGRATDEVVGIPLASERAAALVDHWLGKIDESLAAWREALIADHGSTGHSFFAELGNREREHWRREALRGTLQPDFAVPPRTPVVPDRIDWSEVFGCEPQRTPADALDDALLALTAPFTADELQAMPRPLDAAALASRERANARLSDGWPKSWIDFLQWSNGGSFVNAGGRELDLMDPGEIRSMLVATGPLFAAGRAPLWHRWRRRVLSLRSAPARGQRRISDRVAARKRVAMVGDGGVGAFVLRVLRRRRTTCRPRVTRQVLPHDSPIRKNRVAYSRIEVRHRQCCSPGNRLPPLPDCTHSGDGRVP